MKVLHLLATGNNGGIERLVYDYSRYSMHDNVFIFAWGAGICGIKIKNLNNKVYDIDGHKIGDLKTIKIIKLIIKEENPDFIIIHHASALLRLISLFFPSNKIVVYQHNDPSNNFNDFSVKTLIKIIISKLAFEHARKIISISKYVKNNLMSFYRINNEKILIIYNGTDIDEFYFHPHYYDGTLHFVTVSRLTREKGIQNSINMLANLPKNIKWDYTIIGDGEYKNELIEISKQYGDKIHFLGDCNNVSMLLDDKDVFLHLCECNEGFGITIIEAMAKGKICIVNNKGAVNEIINNKIDGYLINDYHEGVEYIKSIAESYDEHIKIINNSKNTATKFSIKNFVYELDKLLEKLNSKEII